MTKLICPECRRENEPERIYCHECGARLDRSALAKAPVTEEKPEDTHKRLRSMFDPHRDRLRRNFFQISRLILGALATAAVIQMLLPPDVPAAKKSPGISAPIGLDLENAARTHGAPPLRYTEEQANAYLAYALKNKKASLSSWPQFERALVNFDQDICRLTVERSLFGYSLYTGRACRVALQNGALTSETRAGSIGRLPVHPKLMDVSGFLFRDVATALDHDRKALMKMAAIEFQPQAVVITPQP
jgi:hypothetical protein